MAGASEHDAPLKAKLEVARWGEREHFRVHPRMIRRGVPFEAPIEEVVAKRTEHPGEIADVKRFDTIDAEGINVLRIVGPGHCAAGCGTEPRIGFAPGYLVPCDVEGQCAFDDAKWIHSGDSGRWNCRI